MQDYITALNLAKVEYKLDQPLSKYGSYGTGGNAKIMVFPKTHEQLQVCANTQMPIATIGLASNVLFSDSGFNGVIVNTQFMNNIHINGSVIVAQSGAKLSDLALSAELNCLGGLEFTYGIPATIGGAVCMNAGCFSKSIAEYVSYVKTNRQVYSNAECEFGYRSSIFDKKGEIISLVGLTLKPSETDIIQSKKERFKKLRKNSQPHGRSCGSVFLNDGYFAGKIIDLCGLKGFSIGGAKVSEKHANFIINTGNKSSDVYKLVNYIKQKVYERENVKLKEELRFIGNFDD